MLKPDVPPTSARQAAMPRSLHGAALLDEGFDDAG